MKTETIPKTLPSLADICPKCGQSMSAVLCEHFIERSCPCGYYCKDLSGETKLNYYAAVGTFTITRSRR